MCVSPINIKKVSSDGSVHWIAVPCGKCPECLAKYQNAWSLRLQAESLLWKYCWFFTLTYNNDTVPYRVDSETGEYYLTVYKKDVQDWIKRFRTNYERRTGQKCSMRYFLTSEYGPNTQRPHYHLLLFTNFGIEEVSYAKRDWEENFGFTVLKQCDTMRGVSRYVTKYCSKGVYENPLVKENKVDKTFHLISKFIGANVIEGLKRAWYQKLNSVYSHEERKGDFHGFNRDYIDFIIDHGKKYSDGQYVYTMPRYWSDNILLVSKYRDKEVWSPKDKKFVIKKVKDYDRNSYLQNAIKARILERADEIYNKECGEIQSQNPTWTAAQVHAAYFQKQHNLLEERAKQAAEKQAKFLLKGKYDGLFTSSCKYEKAPEGRLLGEYVEQNENFLDTDIDIFDNSFDID